MAKKDAVALFSEAEAALRDEQFEARLGYEF